VNALAAAVHLAGGYVESIDRVERAADYHGVRAQFNVAIPTDVKIPEDDDD